MFTAGTPHVSRTVTFESAYDVSFALSLRFCANSCNFSCDASAKPVAKTCCAHVFDSMH